MQNGTVLKRLFEKGFFYRRIETEDSGFSQRFGLLGLMTALPTTPEFITYDAVYLPKNHFIKQETLSTEDYLAYFFPFDKISFVKKDRESTWNTDSREMFAVIMTLQDKPQAVLMSFQKEYAESYEWDYHGIL